MLRASEPVSMRAVLFTALVSAACSGPAERCEPLMNTGGPTCVPDGGVAPAGQPLSLQLRAFAGGGCQRVESECQVTVDGGEIRLAAVGISCEPVVVQACTDDIRFETKTCTVPALPVGDYTVTSAGETSRALQVRDAGATSCSVSFF